jgi:small GTP-binding protein
MAIDLKLVLLGHKNVGKTSLFNRYVYDEWGKTSMTIGAYLGMKQCKIDNQSVNLAIWDTAGEEKFDSLTSFYCRNARAALICYDITSYETFEGLKRWVEKIEAEAEKNCAIVLVGNKLDIVQEDESKRKVQFTEAKRYAGTLGAHVFEASAKTAENITKCFEQVVQTSLDRQGTTLAATKKQTFPDKPEAPASSGGCC